ncbi:MAG: DUF808 domain-containing protein [Propionibacteriaceae bacterium]|nr:DUF808 domain-containing protein [Propionibacteriaceae bacterium]
MSGGLAALLDDVAALAKLAAASVDDVAAAAGRASMKAAGVVVDDTAVTPQYVAGVNPKRELPIIKKIALGSLRNKLLIILPVILLLSQFLPWFLTPLLMVGGTYLCFEGAEKLLEWLRRDEPQKEVPAVLQGPEAEGNVVKGAIRTDFILSAEIMVISLNEVAAEGFVSRAVILMVVAFGITALVYGVVALIVKMDDVGLALAGRDSKRSQAVGRALVSAMPKVLTALSVVGIFAMLWVGGHIILVGLDELGLESPYALVHWLEGLVVGVTGVGATLAWIVNTLCSLVLGTLWGFVVLGVLHTVGWPKNHHGDSRDEALTADDSASGTS